MRETMEYRRAGKDDVDAFTDHRMEFVAAVTDIENFAEFKTSTRQYLKEHIEQSDLLIYLAVENGEIIASSMACIYQTAPRPCCPAGRYAELLNVYTRPAYRRRGHAQTLLRMLIDDAKTRGVEKILLHATDTAVPLYHKLGFTAIALREEMELNLHSIVFQPTENTEHTE